MAGRAWPKITLPEWLPSPVHPSLPLPCLSPEIETMVWSSKPRKGIRGEGGALPGYNYLQKVGKG